MFELAFLSGARAGAIVTVQGSMSAGRSPECGLEVPDPNVSRHHAQVEWDGAQLIVTDRKSSNGSFVNDQRVDRAVLKHGDILRLGETRMRVQRKNRRSGDSDEDSSVFSFRDSGADLSQSMSMSMLHVPVSIEKDPEALSQRLNAIMWVAEQLASIAKLDDLYGPVLDTLFEVFPQAERGFLLLGNDFELLVPKAMRLRDGSTKQSTDNLEVSSSLCREALRKKEVICYSDGGDTDFDQGMSIVSLNIRSAMVVPLMVKEEVLGLLVVDTSDRRRAFTENDMELAAAVCRQIAIAIKNALLLEQVEAETKVRGNLMRFLPRPVVDQAVKGDIDLALGGSTCHGTIFYADVIGFTRMAETMSPEETIAMMNGFFDRMVPCIEGEGGAIDKFMGDCIMAFWGIPFGQADAVLRATASGLSMQNGLVGLNSLRVLDDKPALSMGIGLNSGPVVAGNIGSSDRVEYTVLGNSVNCAQRIQSQACRNQVLLGEQGWRELDGTGFGVRMPPVQVKNVSEAVTTYCVRGVTLESEILMHLPVLIDEQPGYLVRRLSDQAFILLHEEGLELDGKTLISDVIELPPTELSRIDQNDRLPSQRVDGKLSRSQVSLSDPSLAGLLGDEPLVCERGWEDMVRGAALSL